MGNTDSSSTNIKPSQNPEKRRKNKQSSSTSRTSRVTVVSDSSRTSFPDPNPSTSQSNISSLNTSYQGMNTNLSTSSSSTRPSVESSSGTSSEASPSFITQVEKGKGGPSQQQLEKVRQQSAVQPQPQQENDEDGKLLPPQQPQLHGKPLLVLDLDETLVHSSFKPVTIPDLILPVEIKGNLYQVYVKKRPHVDDFLKSVAEWWEVAVFTASVPEYADPLLDELDPDSTLIQHRLFRQHCTYTNGLYVKDLSRLNRPLSRVVIIDNSPTAYLFHPRNALPVTSWFDDATDTELLDLLPALEELALSPEVYPLLDEFMAVLRGGETTG